jgi:two-component system chemotaxis sensor kinase CheA
MQASPKGYFGKYRAIILAVAFFLVLDMAVLVLNFYVSFQISEDALAINLAGRQRMLSQRMTKALLAAETDSQHGLPDTEAIAELNKTVALFDTTLMGFEQGGQTTGGDDKPVLLAAVTTPEGREILLKANAIWQPYKEMLAPLVSAPLAPGSRHTPEQLDAAVRFARANNLNLLALMNKLTTNMEHTANAKADTLRKVQAVSMLLALLNFAFILFKFIRRLRENDRKVEVAQNETAEILATVGEGLFLLDSEFRIGSQYSVSLGTMLGRHIEPGADFRALIRDMIPTNIFTTACGYIELLFSSHVKESLMGGLNPLSKVEVTVRDSNGIAVQRFLTLKFNRVLEDGKTMHLLVTMFDVTNEVELERALVDAKVEAKVEIEGLLDLLKIDPMTLNNFLQQTEQALLEVNEELRSAGGEINYRLPDYRRTIDTVFRKIHTLKGEAAMLGLEVFEVLAQNFELLLSGLRGKATISGADLLALPFPLEEFLQRVAMVRGLTVRLAAYHDAFAPALTSDYFAGNLEKLVERIALDHGKQVQLTTDLHLLNALPQQTCNELKDIAVQLLRNAVAHGIEIADERMGRAKPVSGNIHITLKPAHEGEYEFVLRDDGRGLNPVHIRKALLLSGRYPESHLNELDDRQVLMKIFEPGFSTAPQADRNSGHGVGLDVVNQKIQQLGARLRVATREGMFTQFSIFFAA